MIPPRGPRRIGLELEFLAIRRQDAGAATRPELKKTWKTLAKSPGFDLKVDPATGQPVGALYTLQDGQVVVLDSDSGVDVVELALPPLPTLALCQDLLRDVLARFSAAAAEHGVALISAGIQPKTPYYYPDLKTEKAYYRAMGCVPHLVHGHELTQNIAAHQVCVDLALSELAPAVNALNALSAVTIALFANSGVGEGGILRHHEEREHRWDLWLGPPKPPRVNRVGGIPRSPFTSFHDYLRYNGSVQLPALRRGASYLAPASPLLIGEFLRREKVTAFDVVQERRREVVPELQDLNHAGTYVKTQARLMYRFSDSVSLAQVLERDGAALDELAAEHLAGLYLEVRNIASQPWPDVMAGPAYALGLIEAVGEADELVRSRPWDFWRRLRKKAIRTSLATPGIVPLAREVLAIAERGLRRRGRGEEEHLAPLYERLERRESPAMAAIAEFRARGLEEYAAARVLPFAE